MEIRIAIIGIIVEDSEQSSALNELLHSYSNIIIGRMGVPYRNKNIGVISIIVDGPNDVINTLSGKLGNIKGLNVKTMYAKVTQKK